MVLVILILATVVTTVVMIVKSWTPVLSAIAALSIGAFVCLMWVLVAGSILHKDYLSEVPTNRILEVSETEKNLVAMSNDTHTSGEYSGMLFVSRGFVEGKQVIEHISEVDGAVQIGYTDADAAKIYEDSTAEDAYMVTVETKVGYWWWAPTSWVHIGYEGVEYHVPEGSVKGGYDLDVSN